MKSVSQAKACRDPQANLGSAEPQHIIYQLRESIAQDVAALSVHLYVLKERAESGALASRIAELQLLASAALHNIAAVVRAIEEGTAPDVGSAIGEHTPARRVSERGGSVQDAARQEVEALKGENERLKQLVAELSGPAGGGRRSQVGIARRRTRTVVGELSSG